MSEAAVVEITLARLVHLEQRIGGAESEGLRARWEFGRELAGRKVGKKLKAGVLREVCAATGASEREIRYRVQFFEAYPDVNAFGNAVAEYRSWHAIVNDALAKPKPEPVQTAVTAPDDTFATIVADPPWQYDNKATRGAAEDHYPTMSLEELCALPVSDWAAEQAHLYLWTTNGFLREAFDVMDAWGFTYKTTLVWVKPQIGMGNYFRSSAEYVLFGVRGGLRTKDCNQRNWFEAPRGKHSKKPGLFFDLVEKASYPPYLEMFARQRRLTEDWDYWGNEA